jgi:voltage-gated potassium channel
MKIQKKGKIGGSGVKPPQSHFSNAPLLPSAPPQKHRMLKALERRVETPMLLLSFVWLLVVVTELVLGTTPTLHLLGTGIWLAFLLFFSLKLAVVPKTTVFLKKNWLFVLAILVPVLRLFPYLQKFTLARALTATFGMQVIWILASADIGLRSLRRALGRRGAGYALTLTLIVILAGAAGMLSFEKDSLDAQGIHGYPKALWWTAMQITNIGSGYRPVTPGGQILCLAISIYAAAMFGYLTAIMATFFVGRDAQDPKSEIASQTSIEQLREEVVRLRQSIEDILRLIPTRPNSEGAAVANASIELQKEKNL